VQDGFHFVKLDINKVNIMNTDRVLRRSPTVVDPS